MSGSNRIPQWEAPKPHEGETSSDYALRLSKSVDSFVSRHVDHLNSVIERAEQDARCEAYAFAASLIARSDPEAAQRLLAMSSPAGQRMC